MGDFFLKTKVTGPKKWKVKKGDPPSLSNGMVCFCEFFKGLAGSSGFLSCRVDLCESLGIGRRR